MWARTMGPTGDGREGGTAAVVGTILPSTCEEAQTQDGTCTIRHSGIRVGLQKTGGIPFLSWLKLYLESG